MNPKGHIHPPKWPLKLLRGLVKPHYLEEIEGDMEEVFADYLEMHSPARAKRRYIIETLKLLRPSLLRGMSGSYQLNYFGMFKLMVKSATRNYFKHRMVATMSLLTLIFGSVCFQLINAWLQNEQSMDQFHSESDRIYIAVAKLNPKAELSPLHVQRIFNLDYSKFPQIEKSLIVHTYGEDEIKLIKEEVEFGGKALIADSTFFDFFDFELIRGDQFVLNDPSSIVLTQEFAERVFGNEDPMGKLVSIRCDQTGTYKVAGITANIPSNSSISFDFLVPRQSKGFWRRMPQDLLLVNDNFNREVFNQQIESVGRENARFPDSQISTIPLNTVYNDRPFNISLFSKYGDSTSFKTMQFVAAIVFLITLISFVNLQSTLQLTLVKKLGVKQVMGASKFDLGFEVVVSRLLYFLVASGMAYLLYQFTFPWYVNTMELSLDFYPIRNLFNLLTVIGIIVMISIITSLIQTAKIKTMQAISGEANMLKIPRSQRVMTTIQYSVTVLLLVATSVVFLQLRFMLNKDTGLNQTNIIKTDFFELSPNGAQDSLAQQNMELQFQYVMSHIAEQPNVMAVSQGSMPIDIAYQNDWKVVGSQDGYNSVNSMSVDPHYGELFGLQLVKGRFFADSLDTNNSPKLVINEAAMKYWGIDDIGQVKLTTNSRSNETVSYNIIGVVKDYHYEHLSQKIRPLVLSYYTYMDSDILIRVKPEKQAEIFSFLEELFNEINPRGFFTYTTMEEQIAQQYSKEQQTGKIYLALSIVALLLSSVGLFTFAFHETKRRTKEIGIRKVNGANAGNVFWLLSRSFLNSIIIAFILACPVAWFLMKQWLDNFAYRVAISWWVFGLVGLLVTMVALIAISWQTLRVAYLNPIDSLRYE
ncbi:ABC transporter permease [Roseivirga sp.]|uniref:ABC transporter permease n=1 Tax=Roseivirga sp. TaxID=1964215 RepID=UPI002B26F911|nr:ABC transporter permease [Roseivirga sp.]